MGEATKKHIIVPFLLLIIVSYVLFGIFGFLELVKNENIKNAATLWEEAKEQETAIKAFFLERKSELLFLSQVLSMDMTNQTRSVFDFFLTKGKTYNSLFYFDLNGHVKESVIAQFKQGSLYKDQEHALSIFKKNFANILSRPKGDVYASQVSLHKPIQELHSYFEPVVHIATPVFNKKNQKIGIVAGEIQASLFIDDFKEISRVQKGNSILARRDGNYIAHYESNREWGSEFETHEGIIRDFSQNFVWKMFSGRPGSLREDNGSFVVYLPFLIDPMQPEYFWLIIQRLSPTPLSNVIAQNRMEIGIFLLLFATSLILIWTFGLRYLSAQKTLDSARSDFIAILTHDLRSPLSTIKTSLDILFKGLFKPEEKNEVQACALTATNSMAKVINEFLDLAKLEAGKMPITLTRERIKPIIDRATALLKEKAKQNKITLTPSLGDNLPEILMDSDKIERVLVNLIDNAIKYTPEGGTVHIYAHQKNLIYAMEIIVSDTGHGIPRKKLDKIFSKYEQVRKDDNRKGTGLGLPIVKEIILAHRGKIYVKSVLGKGTSFHIFLR